MSVNFSDLLQEVFGELKRELIPPLHIRMGSDVEAKEEFHLPIEGKVSGLASTHTYVLGSSGVGKTKWLEGIVRSLIEQGYGVVVLDGKAGETCLYENLVKYYAFRDLRDRMGLAEKTILIDPNDDRYSVGINYLEPLGKTTPDALAGLVLEALKKFFGESNEYKPWLEEWLPPSLVPLIKAGFTLLELFHFLNLQEPMFRDAVLEELDEGYYKTKWETLRDFRPYERAQILNVVRTRASTFWQDGTLKAIFGQQKTTIDWLRVMDEGGIVLAKLGRTPRLPERTSGLIGSALLHQVTTIASERPKNKRRPFFFVVDEFQKFVTPDFGDGLERMREYGISFILAHQHRRQFDKEAPEILNSIDSCALNKVVFACSRKDAEDIAPDIYSGLTHKGAEEVKDEIKQSKQRAILTWKDIVSHSESESESHTTSTSYGTARSKSAGMSASTSYGNSHGMSVSEGYTYSMDRPFGEGTVSNSSGVITTDSTGGGYTDSESETITHTEQTGEAETKGRTRGKTITPTPVTEHEDFREVSSRTFFGLDEVKERFISEVRNQPARQVRWKFKEEYPIPIVTPTIESVDYVTENARRRFTEVGYALHARLTSEVNQEIDGRVDKFLKLAEVAQAAQEVDRDPEDDLE